MTEVPETREEPNTLVRLQEESPGQGHVALRMGPRSPGSGLEQRHEPADADVSASARSLGSGKSASGLAARAKAIALLAEIEPDHAERDRPHPAAGGPRTASSSGPIGSGVRTSAVSPTSPRRGDARGRNGR